MNLITQRSTRLIAGALISLSITAGAFAADPQKSLYERLGGKPALQAVVGELWAVASTDTRINARFAATKPEVFGAQLVDFLCQASGGPCQYKGKDMKAAHTGMKLTNDEFNALADDVTKALNKFKVPAKEQGEVLGMLGSLRSDVVGQ